MKSVGCSLILTINQKQKFNMWITVPDSVCLLTAWVDYFPLLTVNYDSRLKDNKIFLYLLILAFGCLLILTAGKSRKSTLAMPDRACLLKAAVEYFLLLSMVNYDSGMVESKDYRIFLYLLKLAVGGFWMCHNINFGQVQKISIWMTKPDFVCLLKAWVVYFSLLSMVIYTSRSKDGRIFKYLLKLCVGSLLILTVAQGQKINIWMTMPDCDCLWPDCDCLVFHGWNTYLC